MSQEVIIRNYRKSDYAATIHIFKELATLYKFQFEEEKWKEDSGLRLFSPGYKRLTLIAELAGEVVGMGFVEIKDEPTGEVIGYMSNWGVLQKFHRRGIGEQLLKKAVTILESFNVDVIRLNFSYDVSKKLLDRVSQEGFKPVAIACEKSLKGAPTESKGTGITAPKQGAWDGKSTQQITIRNYRKSDSESTMQIFRNLAKDHKFVFEEDKWQDASGLRLFSPGSSRMTLIAELEGAVVGLGFIEVKTEPTGEKIGYLSNWGVAKEYLGKGVGAKLMEKALSILQKMNADAIRINFGYDVNKKLLNHVVSMGFTPVAIACEKSVKKETKHGQDMKLEKAEQVQGDNPEP